MCRCSSAILVFRGVCENVICSVCEVFQVSSFLPGFVNVCTAYSKRRVSIVVVVCRPLEVVIRLVDVFKDLHSVQHPILLGLSTFLPDGFSSVCVIVILRRCYFLI
jgi:hypothetical protein